MPTNNKPIKTYFLNKKFFVSIENKLKTVCFFKNEDFSRVSEN